MTTYGLKTSVMVKQSQYRCYTELEANMTRQSSYANGRQGLTLREAQTHNAIAMTSRIPSLF